MEYLWFLVLIVSVILLVSLIAFVVKMKHFNVRYKHFEKKLGNTIENYRRYQKEKRAVRDNLSRDLKDALKVYSIVQLVHYFLKKDNRKLRNLKKGYLVNQRYINRL